MSPAVETTGDTGEERPECNGGVSGLDKGLYCLVDTPLSSKCNSLEFMGAGPNAPQCPTFEEFIALSGWAMGTADTFFWGNLMTVTRCRDRIEQLEYDEVLWYGGFKGELTFSARFDVQGEMVASYEDEGGPFCCGGSYTEHTYWGRYLSLDCDLGCPYEPEDFQ